MCLCERERQTERETERKGLSSSIVSDRLLSLSYFIYRESESERESVRERERECQRERVTERERESVCVCAALANGDPGACGQREGEFVRRSEREGM